MPGFIKIPTQFFLFLYKSNSLYKEPSLPESPIHDLSVTDSIQQQFPLIDYEMKEYRHPTAAVHLRIKDNQQKHPRRKLKMQNYEWT